MHTIATIFISVGRFVDTHTVCIKPRAQSSFPPVHTRWVGKDISRRKVPKISVQYNSRKWGVSKKIAQSLVWLFIDCTNKNPFCNIHIYIYIIYIYIYVYIYIHSHNLLPCSFSDFIFTVDNRGFRVFIDLPSILIVGKHIHLTPVK